MKILLTNPIKLMVETPTLYGINPPLHLMYIASYLEKEGYEVKILDPVIDKSIKKWVYELKKFDPDVVGISSVSATIYRAWDTAELVKKHTNAKTILGGYHVTFLPGESFYCCPFVDYVVRGEGEITTAELLKCLEGKQKINSVRGISYKKNGKIIHNPPRPWIKNLDDLPYPAWHLVDMYKYVGIVGNSATCISSRGCPRGCSFCISSRQCGLSWRSRSAESVVDEMNQLMSKWPKLDNIIFMDDNFMWGIKRVNEICNLLIKQKSDIKWICQGRADTIVKGGKELLDRMYNAGCIAIQIGVESPFKDRLKAVSKGINKNDAVQSIKLTLDSGILVRATYLFGFEDETKEKMRQTLDFAIENKSQFVQLGIITPFPGSPYFENIKHKMNTHDWRKLTVAHQFLDYGFDMERELAKIFIKFNFRPSYINMVGKLDINQSWGLITFIYPLTKVIAGSAIDCLYDFNPNKWCQTDEEYWQKYILKTDLTFEETWYYDKPKIDPLQIPYKPVREIYPVVKEIVPVKLPIAKWVRI